MRSLSLVLAIASWTTALACGGDDEGGAGGGTSGAGGEGGTIDDGLFRPPPNGVAIDEAAACAKVEDAFQDRAAELGCAATSRSCPDLIRAPSGAPTCSQYDEGAADGCATFVREAADCEALRGRPDACFVEPVEGSAPAGCPA